MTPRPRANPGGPRQEAQTSLSLGLRGRWAHALQTQETFPATPEAPWVGLLARQPSGSHWSGLGAGGDRYGPASGTEPGEAKVTSAVLLLCAAVHGGRVGVGLNHRSAP